MRSSRRRDEAASQVFGLSEESVGIRNRWRFLTGIVIWVMLSSMTILFTIFTADLPQHRAVIVFLSFLKYAPLLWVVYTLAKQKAAQYLEDIFELNDEDIAMEFIEEVAFGYGHEYITINEGRISEEDELSPIILIGGPGQIQVNLGSAALLEKLDGEPEVIYARGEPWNLGRFERIREIGRHDQVGMREYAVINLRDQFIDNISVKARTKDGVPIEALDIKIRFSVLRSQNTDGNENDPYSFEESALQALVYKQITITPPPSSSSGVSFPWDTTVIPLVKTELERLISSHTLSDSNLFASIGQKELDTIAKNEETVAQMRVEMTGAHAAHQIGKPLPKNKETRPNIAAQFLNADFHKKAADLGVSIQWIDIGTWKVASPIIDKKLKDGWNLIDENSKRQKNIEKLTKKYQTEELIELITNVVILNFEKDLIPELREIRRLLENDPNLNV
ncbi:MAG: hypothetical protein IH588_18575, partial [Anaerolineales bacterium]|nr:hypothetical protein [Anaerolineales bacterium]